MLELLDAFPHLTIAHQPSGIFFSLRSKLFLYCVCVPLVANKPKHRVLGSLAKRIPTHYFVPANFRTVKSKFRTIAVNTP